MNKVVDHWSYSAVETYLKCPFQWYHSYVLKTPKQDRAEFFKIGEGLHYVLEMNAKKFHKEQKRYSYEESVKLFRSKWKKSHELMVRTYYTKDKWLMPMSDEHVEWKFNLDCYGTKLTGVIDIITADKAIVDYKTAKDPYDSNKIKDALQLSLYAGAYLAHFGELPEKVGYQVIMKDFSGVQSLWGTRTLDQVEEAKKLVARCDHEVNNAKVFTKKSGSNCKYCDYKEICNNIERKEMY